MLPILLRLPFFASAGELAIRCIQTVLQEAPQDRKNQQRIRHYFSAFSTWCQERNLDLQAVQTQHMGQYARYLHERHKKSTANNHLRTLRRFFAKMAQGGVSRENPARFVSRAHRGARNFEYPIPTPDKPGSIPSLIREAGAKATSVLCQYFVHLPNERSQRHCAHVIGAFNKWCEEKGISLTQLNAGTFTEYAHVLAGKYARTTIEGRIAILRALCDQLVKGKVLSFNPVNTRLLQMPPRTRLDCRLPSPDEIVILLSSVNSPDIASIRDRAIFAVTFYAFAKTSEIAGLDMQDFFECDGSWWFRFGTREVPANAIVANYLHSYLAAAGLTNCESGPLFRAAARSGKTLTNERMSETSIRVRFIDRRTQAGLPPYMHAISIRGAGIKLFLDSGGTIEKAVALTGMLPGSVSRYAPKDKATVIYEGDLDGLLDLLGGSATGPLQEFVRKSGIFKLTLQDDETE